MTSEEALQHIINLVSDDTYYRDALNEEFEILQKDLEVLDILKRSSKIILVNGTITPEELDKIKERLEYEK